MKIISFPAGLARAGLLGTAVITAALTHVVSAGEAATLPQYDVTQQCQVYAVAAGDGADADYQDCVKRESQDAKVAKRMAPRASAFTMAYCNDQANTGDGGSYTTLVDCLKLEASANAGPRKIVPKPVVIP